MTLVSLAQASLKNFDLLDKVKSGLKTAPTISGSPSTCYD